MALEIVLRENQLRDMPPDLREKLLKWYFEHLDSPTIPTVPAASTQGSPIGPSSLSSQRDDRVSFPEFVRAGLLQPGAELECKSLKRQKRSGTGGYLDAGKVRTDGSVEYRGRQYYAPSKLAVAVVNTNGGNTKALNGYDYLFVRRPTGRVQLKELRDSLTKGNP